MENQIISVDTRFCFKKTHEIGKYSYKLPQALKNVRYVRVSSIEVPNNYYTFTKKRDNLSFIIVYADKELLVTIPTGSYDNDSLIVVLTDIFSKLNTDNATNFKIEFNEITSKCIISNNLNFSLKFKNTTDYYSLGRHLGFISDDYSNNALYCSESVLDVIGDTYMYLRINDYGVMYTDVLSTDIIAKIIINKNKGNQLYDNESNFLTKSYIFKQPANINTLNFELLDLYGNTIDLLHQNYSFTIELGQIYSVDQKNFLEKNGSFM